MPRHQQPELKGPTEPFVQLATRIPRELHRRIRLVCVQEGRMVQDFIAEAIREALRRRRRG